MGDAPPAADSDALFAEGVSLRVRGIDAHRAGSWHKALDLFVRAERLFHDAGLGAQVAWTMMHEGMVQERVGEPVQAIALLTGAEAMLRYHGDRSGLPLCFRRRADVLRRQGRQEAALGQYCEGEAIYRNFHDPIGMVGLLAGKALSYLAMTRRIEAHACVAEALWKLEQQPPGRGPDVFLIHAIASRVIALAGDVDTAKNHLAQAIRLADLDKLREDLTDPDVENEVKAIAPAQG